MSNQSKNLLHMINNFKEFQQFINELKSATPHVKEALSTLINEIKKPNRTNDEIYTAIQFTINKIRNDPHIVLGCNSNDPVELKKEIYHLKAKYLHPDGAMPDNEKFVQIKNAWDKIKSGSS